jgi:Fe-S cluster assembly protein SufD
MLKNSSLKKGSTSSLSHSSGSTMKRSSFMLAELISSPVPTRKSEHWKYNAIHFLTQERFQCQNDDSFFSSKILSRIQKDIEKQCSEQELSTIFLASNRLIFINGRYCHDLSHINDTSCLHITPIQALNKRQKKRFTSIQEVYGDEANHLIKETDHHLGVFIEIDQKIVLDSPICLVHYGDPLSSHSADSDSNTSSNTISLNNKKTEVLTPLYFSHQTIDIKPSTSCEIMEVFLSSKIKPTSQLYIQKTQVYIESEAQLTHYRFNLEDVHYRQVSHLSHLLSSNSQNHVFCYSKGSELNKTDLKMIHLGKYSSSQVTGIYLPREKTKHDYHLVVEHRIGFCKSDSLFRGIIENEAQAVFNGKIHIFKAAQQTQAHLQNKNLLLTQSSEINTKPELEIYADDVVCSHGASVAKLDEQGMYYLQSRGLSKNQARELMSVGFIQTLIERIKNKKIRESLKALIEKK